MVLWHARMFHSASPNYMPGTIRQVGTHATARRFMSLSVSLSLCLSRCVAVSLSLCSLRGILGVRGMIVGSWEPST